MNFNVNFTFDAAADLKEIYKYILFNDSEQSADNLIDKLRNKCSELKSYPQRGHIPPELQLLYIQDFLEIHCKTYRIIYKINKKNVLIHCILDGRRDMQKLLQERLLR
jgi:toxin ParE1/3/4